MRRLFGTSVMAALCAAFLAISASAAIKGNYVEVRSADVYTGPCFANSEMSLRGDQAILAWDVSQGNWKGTTLDGLSVVAVVKANATLGDIYHDPYPAKAVLIVDSRANSAQRQALEEFAESMGGRLLSHVVRVDFAPINMKVGAGTEHGTVELVAGNLARIETRSLCSGDKICGNEEIYYPPLTAVDHAMPAYTLDDSFSGAGLGVVWNLRSERSAFVGTFTL